MMNDVHVNDVECDINHAGLMPVLDFDRGAELTLVFELLSGAFERV